MTLRERICAEAFTWLNTPWKHAHRVKGVKGGVDCAQFLIGVFSAVGAAPKIETEYYPQDWHLHQGQERFMDYLRQYSEPTADPLPGDVAMFKYGRHPAHGAILMPDGYIIHAWRDEHKVVLTDLSVSPIAERCAGFYRVNGV